MPSPTRRSFLVTAAAATTAKTLRAQRKSAAPLVAYVGTFSSPLKDTLPTQVDLPPGNGRGIHIFHVDRTTGAMTPAGVFESGISPSHLVVNNSGTRLYSANETDRVGTGKPPEGTVSSFAVDPKDGGLKLLNTVRSGGAGPTYVSLHPSGKWLFVANYFGGSVAVLPIKDDGQLGEPTDVKVDEGKVGPTKAKNAPKGSFAISGHDRTHAHQILPDPTGKFVLHVDLGLDRLFVWKFNADKGLLTANEPSGVSFPPGDGPRHVCFRPNGKHLYSVQEEGSTVVRFDYDGDTGKLNERQTISTLPDGYAGSNFCSEILVSPDGNFVYVGNRLHDSIAYYSVRNDGRLAYEGEEWTRGNYPRSFAFDPTGEFLYCCNQRADHVTVFEVNRELGRLSFTGQYVPVGNPSCVTFFDLGKAG
jgi:6-phosphogluconolactonase